MTVEKAKYLKDEKNLLCVTRKEGGRRITIIEDCMDVEKSGSRRLYR